jgi:hypothetical protein
MNLQIEQTNRIRKKKVYSTEDIKRNKNNKILRSEYTIRNIHNTNVDKCGEFIGGLHILTEEINNSANSKNTLHNIFKMHSFLNDELENISTHFEYCSSLKPFLIGVANNIPEYIVDIISLKNDNEASVTWKQLTGLSLIESLDIMYNLRFGIRTNVNLY